MIRYNPYIKRLLDIFLASAAFLCLSPIFVFISIFICIDSKGPPFFIHKRIGKGMIPFRLIKFRSMTWKKNAYRGRFDPGNNCRVTKVGKLLRSTKVDELPELFNVLKGEMSIVGPRPEVARYVEAYPEGFKEILHIRPGLSDFASMKYRDEEAILSGQDEPETYYRKVILPDKLQLAKQYIKTISFKSDLSIIGNTLKSILKLPL